MELKVCVGSACHLKGAGHVVETFQTLIRQQKLDGTLKLTGSFCMGKCDEPDITVEFDGTFYNVSAEGAEKFFNDTVLPALKTAAKK